MDWQAWLTIAIVAATVLIAVLRPRKSPGCCDCPLKDNCNKPHKKI